MTPAIVISGYLGAGKTTLINRFLRAPNGVRATVLANDFGAINLDAALIANTSGDTIALTNGCACCSIGDSLLEAALSATKTAPPDLLLVEASGIAHPARIAATLMGVPALAPATCLTVVNGARWQENMQDKYIGKLFRAQIDESDYLCLNRFGQSTLQAFRDTGPQQPVVASIAEIRQTAPPERRGTASPETSSLLRTQTLRLPAPVSMKTLEDWLKNLQGVERLKGVVLIETGDRLPQLCLLNYTQGAFQLSRVDAANTACIGEIVVIFRDSPDFKLGPGP